MSLDLSGCFSQWLGVVRQQAIIVAHVELDCCGYMVSLAHNELVAQSQVVYLCDMAYIVPMHVEPKFTYLLTQVVYSKHIYIALIVSLPNDKNQCFICFQVYIKNASEVCGIYCMLFYFMYFIRMTNHKYSIKYWLAATTNIK